MCIVTPFYAVLKPLVADVSASYVQPSIRWNYYGACNAISVNRDISISCDGQKELVVG
jgi:hypothetical protein